MTIKLMRVIKRFVGLSSDSKPTSIPSGSTFYETDTGDKYITTDDGTTWVLDKRY